MISKSPASFYLARLDRSRHIILLALLQFALQGHEGFFVYLAALASAAPVGALLLAQLIVAMDGLPQLIEALIMLVMGLVVGFVILATLLPIVSLIDSP